jgi:hypothetical protein
LGLFENATLVVMGPKKTRLFNNTVKTIGGGLRLMSGNFIPTQVTDLLLVENNSAPNSADIAVGVTSITVVNDGGADNVIASDSQEGTLELTLNVSGGNGWPSADSIAYSLYKAGEQRSFFPVDTTADGMFRKLPVRLKQRPGEL